MELVFWSRKRGISGDQNKKEKYMWTAALDINANKQVRKQRLQSHHLSPLPFFSATTTTHQRRRSDIKTHHVSSSPMLYNIHSPVSELLQCSVSLRPDHPSTRSAPGRIPAVLWLCHRRRKETEGSVLLLGRSWNRSH